MVLPQKAPHTSTHASKTQANTQAKCKPIDTAKTPLSPSLTDIALCCGMYRGLIFSLMPHHFPFGQVPSSVNLKLFCLPFTSVCFSGLWSSQGLCLSRPGCFGALCLFWVPVLPSGSTAWFWSPGPGSLVLVPWFWSPGSSGPGFIVLCNM